jgi:hypothetical protein
MPIKSDPRRLPQRSQFQEGPGFLFVATQGGRPTGSTIAPDLAEVVRLRAGVLRRWAEGEALSTVCAEAACSRATLFPWRSRSEADGLAGLLDGERHGDRSDLSPGARAGDPRGPDAHSYWNSRRIAAESGDGASRSATARSIACSPGPAPTGRTWPGCPVRATSGRAPTSCGTSTSRAVSFSPIPEAPPDLAVRRPRRRLQPLPARDPGGAGQGGRARPRDAGRGDRAYAASRTS